MTDTETAYLLARAEEEAIAAIQADHPSASAAHRELSMRYSAKAIFELVDERPSSQAELPAT